MSDGTHQLPESSRNALIRMADALRDGFSGTFQVEAHEGGVRSLKVTETLKGKALKDAA